VQNAKLLLSFTRSRGGEGSICVVSVNALLTAKFNVSTKKGKAVVKVTLNEPNFNYSMDQENVIISDISLVEDAVTFAVNEFCRHFNSLFPGIPLPVGLGDGVTFPSVKMYQDWHTVDFGADFSFPLKTLRN